MPEAIQQLRDIRERIAWFGGDTNANRFTQHLMDVVTQADQFPLLGRPVPEFGSERVRDRLVDRYRLIYQVVPDGIEVIARRPRFARRRRITPRPTVCYPHDALLLNHRNRKPHHSIRLSFKPGFRLHLTALHPAVPNATRRLMRA